MIGYVKGEVLHMDESTVLLMTAGGTGYEIICSAAARAALIAQGAGAVYTYLAVRDDGAFLYGFQTLAEKAMFLKLISVSGVGPKMGMAILSQMELGELAVAIAGEDVKKLSCVKGLGKKSAERIILELREKVYAEAAETPATKGKAKVIPAAEPETNVNENAVVALMSLGLTRAECVSLLKKAEEAGMTTVEDMVMFAIRNL